MLQGGKVRMRTAWQCIFFLAVGGVILFFATYTDVGLIWSALSILLVGLRGKD